MQSARGFEYGVRHIISPQSGCLADVLLSITELSYETILFLLDLGSIYINHKRCLQNITINEKDYIRIHTKPRRFPKNDFNWKSRIIYENAHFLLVNKPSGLPVHASVDNIKENLLNYLAEFSQHNLLVTHRLDVPTRGLIVFAKSIEFQSAFNKALINHEINKIYRATVEGHCVPIGLLVHFMEPSPRAPKTVCSQAFQGWQECKLTILSAQNLPDQKSELYIQLHTGRTHQIRSQLGFIHHPIVGDHQYGATKLGEIESIELEACTLEFKNPLTGEEHQFDIK